tara:strand:+ start:104 stop:880 length:777 start_codon:yes stop_codon:yes gene_type:complete
MEENSSFRSVENKRLLWDLLLKNKLFTNISPDKETLVKKLFESKVDMIFNEGNNGQTLSSLNKRLFTVFVPELKKLQINGKEVTFSDNIQNSQGGTGIILADGDIITAEKQMEIRQTQFKNSLDTMQTDFSNMINHEPPKKIDFSDSSNNEDVLDIDKRMEEIIRNRENEMNTLFKGKPPNSKIVYEKDPIAAINEPISKNSSRNRLVIGEKIVIEDIILIRDTTINIITTESLSKLLEDVLNNQRIILDRLETIKIL